MNLIGVLMVVTAMSSHGQTDQVPQDIPVTIVEGHADPDSVRISQGDLLRMTFTCDDARVLHLHGYDLEIRVSAESPVSVEFVAAAAGRFPLESHPVEPGSGETGQHDHKPLLYLEVYPD